MPLIDFDLQNFILLIAFLMSTTNCQTSDTRHHIHPTEIYVSAPSDGM